MTLPKTPRSAILALAVGLSMACGAETAPEAPQCAGLGQVCGGAYGACCQGLTCYAPGSVLTCQLRPTQCQQACLDGYNSCVGVANAHIQPGDAGLVGRDDQIQGCNLTETQCEKGCQ